MRMSPEGDIEGCSPAEFAAAHRAVPVALLRVMRRFVEAHGFRCITAGCGRPAFWAMRPRGVGRYSVVFCSAHAPPQSSPCNEDALLLLEALDGL